MFKITDDNYDKLINMLIEPQLTDDEWDEWERVLDIISSNHELRDAVYHATKSEHDAVTRTCLTIDEMAGTIDANRRYTRDAIAICNRKRREKMTNLIVFDKTDIDWQLARRAHEGTSWVPEQRADQTVRGYLEHMREVQAEFVQWATDDNRDEMSADLRAYKARYIQLLHGYLNAHGRVISQFITGAGNFPTRRNEKRNATCDKRREEWLNFSAKRLKQLRRKYNPRLIARAPVSSGDPEAVVKLRAKIANAKAAHEVMLAANKIVRRKISDEEKVALLAELDSMDEKKAWELLRPDWGKPGFQSYSLSNNRANIKRMEARVESILAESKRRESTPDEYEIGGVTVVENGDANRLQILFESKPPREVRSALKSHGFRWSPRNKAWQRQLNDNARRAARQVLEG